MGFLKVVLSIALIICIYLFGYSAFSAIMSAVDGNFDYVPLIVALVCVAVIVIIIFLEIKVLNKTRYKTEKPVPEKMTLLQKIEQRSKNSKTIFTIFISCFAAIVLALVGIIICTYTDMTSLSLVFVGISVFSCIGLIVFGIIYSSRHEKLVASLKALKKQNLTLEYCLEDIENAITLKGSNLVCTKNAFVIEKSLVVIPYSSILWMFKSVQSVNGISTFAGWVAYTTTGANFAITSLDEEAHWIINTLHSRFAKEFIAGFGRQQKKAYNAAKKQYRNQYKNN